MLPYRHTQPGTVIRWALLASLPLLGLAFWLTPPPPPLIGALRLGVGLLLLASLLLFWSLTIEVTPGHFKLWFGPGLIRKSLPLAQIASWEPVNGLLAWGIHYGGRQRGWLYNVSGRRAVLLRLKNGSALMVGSDEPEAVCAAISEAHAALQAKEGRA
jgi:hypothetical protein